MKLKILLFGQLASAAKTNSFELTFAGKESSVAVIKNIIFDRFPKLEKQVFRMAVNQEIVGDAFSVKDSDEIALLPPMSGGNFSYLATKKITKKMINQILNTTHDSCGSVITFRGIVRADKKRKDVYVTTINYTAYETMAENEINKIVDNAIKRFGLIYVVVKHRLGKVKLNETAFFVAVFSQHRKEGIKSMDFIIDEVKNKVPIWKEEFYSDGSKSFKSGLLIK